ncbi:GntR family transcriptional regulator [Paenibacillus gansuensis]|uniref:GntR family transcriptional regulator n=1 Tax=Paenibacillus gansuensis TaxID=306542 RepID=A0ABW5PL36_9BACL
MSNEFNFKPQVSVSLREKVTNDIREAILSGHLKPGQRIRETEVAEQMGVSRGPIREAIRQLEREGLMVSQPYRETVVADIDLNEVRDILIPIRFQLEWFVVKTYLDRMTDSFFDELQSIVDRMTLLSTARDTEQIAAEDFRFHDTVIALAHERTVKLSWQSIQYQIRLHFNKNASFYDIDKVPGDHQLLLDKLRGRQLNEIQDELLRHIRGDESFLCYTS